MTQEKKYSVGTTSENANNVQHLKISRKKRLFLLFWIAEDDKAKDFFAEAAQTRLINIKTLKNFDKNFDKVHSIPLCGFTEIQESIDYWIKKYGGKEKIKMKEVSFFSHSGVDGPIIYSATSTTPIYMLFDGYLQLKTEYWKKINYYWGAWGQLNFFGCNSAYEGNSFVKKISLSSNVEDIIVSGQLTSSFPSFYPDKRLTNYKRSLVFKGTNYSPKVAWETGPTYMVGGNGGEGEKAINGGVPANKMGVYKNGIKLYNSFQSTFNDHRINRKNMDNSNEYQTLARWRSFGY